VYATIGTIVALAGAALIELDTSHSSSSSRNGNPSPTVAGDLAALLGAVAMAFYLMVGGGMRQWMPLWLYVQPVNLVAAISASILALGAERTDIGGHGTHGSFGWFFHGNLALLALLAGGISGVMGHTLASFSLKTVSW
jgi:drug/metabolite transporter (DMT)-like permease